MAELFKTLRVVKPTIAAPVAAKPAKKAASRVTPAAKAAEAIKASPPDPATQFGDRRQIRRFKAASRSGRATRRAGGRSRLAQSSSARPRCTARSAELERKLKKERQTALPARPDRGADSPYSASELQPRSSQPGSARVLQKRYHEAQSALGTMKANHTRVLQQLDDTHKRLNEERRENLKLAAEEKRLAMELDAAHEFEPALEQSRRERAALEKENHQLLRRR